MSTYTVKIVKALGRIVAMHRRTSFSVRLGSCQSLTGRNLASQSHLELSKSQITTRSETFYSVILYVGISCSVEWNCLQIFLPDQTVAVSVPAKYTRPIGSRKTLQKLVITPHGMMLT